MILSISFSSNNFKLENFVLSPKKKNDIRPLYLHFDPFTLIQNEAMCI